MENYYSMLTNCPLFRNLSCSDLEHILPCLGTQIKTYLPDDYIILLGSQVDYVSIVLEGTVEILKENLAGDRHIVAILEPPHLFGEGIVCTHHRTAPVTVRTRCETKLLLIPYEKIITTCTNSCGFHTKLIYNMMLLLGEKNYVLNHKIDLLMLKGMKEKIATFLLYQRSQREMDTFQIGFNRNELAEYLNVSRPSMSRELARMKEAGLIDYHKNTFQILDYDGLTSLLCEV